MPRFALTTFLTLLVVLTSWAADPPAKPPIRLAEDGFPSGSDTPEGAACDLARAFIRCNDALFLKVCLPPYGEGETREAYQEFLDKMGLDMKNGELPSGGPRKLAKCFAARHLSKSGPVAYGAATFGAQDVMFVDVGIYLEDSQPQLRRTLVIKDKSGKWIVHPLPGLVPSLSDGLSEESPSKEDFSEVYLVK